MDNLNSTNPDQSATDKLHTLEKKYADVFEFLVFSAAKMTNMEHCSLSITVEEQVYILASTAASLTGIYPLNPQFVLNNEDSVYLPENSDLKFRRSYPVSGLDGDMIGHLNLFANQVQDFNDEVQQIIDRDDRHASKWY